MSEAEDCFKIEGPATIGFSGGETSAYMLRRILDACDGKLPADVFVHFQNTGEEDERTLRFVHEVETRWNVPIIWLEYDADFEASNYSVETTRRVLRRNPLTEPDYRIVNYSTASRKGEPFDKMVRYYAQYRQAIKKAPAVLPNPAQRMCTEFLKIRVGENFMRANGYDYWDGYVGIRADEPKRLAKMREANQANRRRWEGVAPLAGAGIVKADVVAFWGSQPFRLTLKSYEGNCRMCFLKAAPKLYRLQKERPQETGIERWIAREQQTGQRFRNDRDSYETIAGRAPMICVNCWENDALADGRFCYRCILMPGGVQCASDDLADCFCGE